MWNIITFGIFIAMLVMVCLINSKLKKIFKALQSKEQDDHTTKE